MDLSRLTTGDKVIGGSGLALFVFAWLPWFSFLSFSQRGYHFFFTGLVPVALGLAMIGYVVSTRMADLDLPDTPVEPVRLLLGFGVAAAALVTLRLILGSDEGAEVLDRTIGLFLSVLAAIGLAVGAFLNLQEDAAASGPTGSRGTPTPF